MNKTFPCLAENATYFSTETALTITKAKFVTEYKKMSQMRKNNFKKKQKKQKTKAGLIYEALCIISKGY